MKSARHAPAVTSLPQAPQDEASRRVRNYWITMGVRMLCFVLTVVVTPYSWYTWIFAIGAAVLPYIAVVFANAVSPASVDAPESPTQQLTAPDEAPAADDAPSQAPGIITIHEHGGDDA